MSSGFIGDAKKVEQTFTYQVGRFVLAFGSIEHATYLCLHTIPRDDIAQFVKNLSLGARLDLLAEILASRAGPEVGRLLFWLNKVKKFTEHRNLVAHNGLSLNVFQGDGKLEFLTEIVSARDKTKRVSLAQVTKLANEADELGQQFGAAVLAAVKALCDANGNPHVTESLRLV